MTKGIGLIRVSTEEQSSAEHAGVPAQRHSIQTIAQQRGIELVKTFEITDVSGSRLLASPEFQEFLRHLEEPSIRAVVTKEFSRLMGRLGPLLVVRSTNPGSEGLTDHSTGGLMLHHPGHVPSQRGPSGDKGRRISL